MTTKPFLLKASSEIVSAQMIRGVVFGIIILFLILSGVGMIPGARAETLLSESIGLHFEKQYDVPTQGGAVAVTWSPDGLYLAAASNYGQVLTVWDRAGHPVSEFRRFGGGPALGGSLVFVGGSSKLMFPPPDSAAADAALAIWNVTSGKVVDEIIGPQPGQAYGGSRAVYFQLSATQDLLAVGTYARDINLFFYSINERRMLETARIDGRIFSLCLFGHDRLVAVGSSKGRIEIFDISDNAKRSTLQGYDDSDYGDIAIGAVAGSPDGNLIFAGAGQILIKGQYARTPESAAWEAHIKTAWVLNFQDGKRLISFPETVALPIRKATWDPDGRYVAFIDNARSLYVWQPLTPSNAFQTIRLSSAGFSMATSPNGNMISVTTNSGISVFSLKEK